MLFLCLGFMLSLGGNNPYSQAMDDTTAKPSREGSPPLHMRSHAMENFRGGGCEPGTRCGLGSIKRIISELELSPDQREKIDRLLAKNEEQNKTLINSLQKARGELKTIISAPTFNENEFRKAFRQASSIREELMVLRMKTLSEINQVLTPEQQGYLRGRLAGRWGVGGGRRHLKEKGRLNAGKAE